MASEVENERNVNNSPQDQNKLRNRKRGKESFKVRFVYTDIV